MSAEHRRPLLAFVVVAMLCAFSLVHALRSDAVVGFFRTLPSLSAPGADRVQAAGPRGAHEGAGAGRPAEQGVGPCPGRSRAARP